MTGHWHAALGWAACFLGALLVVLGGQAIVLRSRAREAAAPQYPLWRAHCRSCTQCASEPVGPTGDDQSLCDIGFRLLQQDIRNARGGYR